MFHPEIINVSLLQKALHTSLEDTWGRSGDSWGTPEGQVCSVSRRVQVRGFGLSVPVVQSQLYRTTLFLFGQQCFDGVRQRS